MGKRNYTLKLFSFKAASRCRRLQNTVKYHRSRGFEMLFSKDVLLCEILENPSRLMIAELP